MTRRPERADFDSAAQELRVLLRTWDPIGVLLEDSPDWAADEYDCLIPGLYQRLRDGGSEDALLEFLTHELVSHFGLESRPTVDRAFAAELVTWWNARDQLQSEA